MVDYDYPITTCTICGKEVLPKNTPNRSIKEFCNNYNSTNYPSYISKQYCEGHTFSKPVNRADRRNKKRRRR